MIFTVPERVILKEVNKNRKLLWIVLLAWPENLSGTSSKSANLTFLFGLVPVKQTIEIDKENGVQSDFESEGPTSQIISGFRQKQISNKLDGPLKKHR